MEGRRSGFLWDDERDLVDAHLTSLGSVNTVNQQKLAAMRKPTEVKSRMKGDIASPEGLREVLRAIQKDLERIDAYYCRVKDQPGGRWEWSDQVLPQIQSEVEALSSLLESWEVEADRTGRRRVREVLADALAPLHDGLDDLDRALNGEYTPSEERMARESAAAAPTGLADDYRELAARRTALLELLKDAELRVIFQYIGTHEKKKLPDRKKGGNTWAWWASRYLAREHKLIEESSWGYRLTTRGKLVDEVLWKLEEKPLLELLGQGRMSTAEAALQLLPHHVRADRWDAWENL